MYQHIKKNDLKIMCKIFKLSNGESIICIVKKETPSYVEIETPFKLNTLYTPHGTVNLAVFKWDHTIDYDSPIRIYKNSIVAIGNPNDDMYYNYTAMINAEPENKINEDLLHKDISNNEVDSLMTKFLQNFNSDNVH